MNLSLAVRKTLGWVEKSMKVLSKEIKKEPLKPKANVWVMSLDKQ